jgi:hypothetical protein
LSDSIQSRQPPNCTELAVDHDLLYEAVCKHRFNSGPILPNTCTTIVVNTTTFTAQPNLLLLLLLLW